MNANWQGLFSNLAALAAFMMVWTIMQDSLAKLAARHRAIVLGLITGCGAVMLMLDPFEIAPGIIFDFRGALLANAGLFGGPVSAVICAAFALAYRIHLGGAGVVSGCAGIVVAMLIGIVGHRLVNGRQPRLSFLAIFSFVAAAGICCCILILPADIRIAILIQVGPPSAFLTFFATLMTGLILRQEQRRRELVHSNTLYRATIEALPDCLNVKSLDGRFQAANPATAALMLAGTADQLIGKSDFDFYPDDVARTFRRDEERVIATGVAETIDQQVFFADGAERWLSTLKVPLRDQNGTLIGLITHNRDITDRKRLRRKLDAARDRLNDALENMSDGLVIYDCGGKLVFCNSRYQSLFPKTAHVRVPGATYTDILYEAVRCGEIQNDPSVDLDVWIEQRRDQRRHGLLELIPLVDGRWLQVRKSVVKEGTLYIVTDVTDQKHAETELKSAEAEYRALFENSVAGIFRSSPDGGLLRANPALARLNGYEREGELLAAVNDIAREWYVDPERRAQFKQLMERDGRVTDFVSEIYQHRTRERIWISETAWTVFDADHNVRCYEGTVVDVTERKRAEDDLAAATRRLEELAAIDGLTGLANRRVFDQTLAQEFARAAREERPLSLIMIDVDRFKAYNDTYGHLAGDDCLRLLSQTLQTLLKRPADVACRYGGEELAMILPDTDAAGALVVAEAFRDAVKALSIAHQSSELGMVSISAGVATAGSGVAGSAEDLVRRADRALYGAKKNGRDRVLPALAA